MNTLLGKDVLVTRATLETAVERLALQCARGTTQDATVREWIEQGVLTTTVVRVPLSTGWGRYTLQDVRVKGSKHLSGSSWSNLVKRLSAAGFKVTYDVRTQTYSLYWRNY